jgi:hypothetical protein
MKNSLLITLSFLSALPFPFKPQHALKYAFLLGAYVNAVLFFSGKPSHALFFHRTSPTKTNTHRRRFRRRD